MTYETYHTVFLSAGILAIIFAVCSVLLFVLLKIPKVVGDLSGRTARKGIADIREQNVRTGDKRHKTSAVNLDRGRITDRITDSGNIQRVGKTVNTGVMTQKINMPESEEMTETSETTVLPTAEYSETVVLDEIRMDDDFAIEEEICFIHTDEKIG
ncbi:hypothetical protein [uncultured Eubacterium sp.]|uniref:hypothetical protein n=1 Tax=uncultured Eubacterium sp. TaxID=165185 RepID=UPI0025FCF905|nr:hypothetical protein [uncultured Eubacterium sp.]MCI6536112.1 hypothetical protein [Lachnospiraceae bacterium]